MAFAPVMAVIPFGTVQSPNHFYIICLTKKGKKFQRKWETQNCPLFVLILAGISRSTREPTKKYIRHGPCVQRLVYLGSPKLHYTQDRIDWCMLNKVLLKK